MTISPLTLDILHYIFVWAPIWLPLALLHEFQKYWIKYIQADFVSRQKSTLLEIRIPNDITKSPAAMEIIYNAIFQKGEPDTYLEGLWEGKVRPWFSFELVSIGGHVKFYIWTLSKYADHLEAQIYAQYPNVEVHRVKDDYTHKFTYKPGKNAVFGMQWKLSKPDPFPIKTYVEFGMDEDPDEEHRIDPMAATLEYLGSRKEHEQVWIQIMIQAHREKISKEGYWKWSWKGDDPKKPWSERKHWLEKPSWKKKGEAEIKKLREAAMMESGGSADDKIRKFPNPTKGQMEVIAAIERSLAKFPFDTMIRGIYLVEDKTKFDGNAITGLNGIWKQYNTNDRNRFTMAWRTDFHNSKYFGKVGKEIKDTISDHIVEAYKRRSFFQFPYKDLGYRRDFKWGYLGYLAGKFGYEMGILERDQDPYVLGTDELATIYHFPSNVAQTPTLPRIASRKSEAPPNLPI